MDLSAGVSRGKSQWVLAHCSLVLTTQNQRDWNLLTCVVPLGRVKSVMSVVETKKRLCGTCVGVLRRLKSTVTHFMLGLIVRFHKWIKSTYFMMGLFNFSRDWNLFTYAGFVAFLNNLKSTHFIPECCDFPILKYTQFMPGTEIYLLSDGLVGFLVPYDWLGGFLHHRTWSKTLSSWHLPTNHHNAD